MELDKSMLMEYLLFEGLYESSKRLFGEWATRQLIFLSIREAVKKVVDNLNMKEELKKMSYCDIFKLIFNIFDINEVECNEKEFKVVVRNCPLPLKHDPNREGRACVVMIAILAGVAESLTGMKILIETPVIRLGSPNPDIKIRMTKSIVLGDCCCEFVGSIPRERVSSE